MNISLPPTFNVVETSFKAAWHHQKNLLRLNLLSLVDPLSRIAMGFLMVAWITFFGFDSTQILPRLILFLLGAALFGVCAVWYGAHYLLRVLNITKGDLAPIAAKTSWARLPDTLVVVILQILGVAIIPFILLIVISFILSSSQLASGAVGDWTNTKALFVIPILAFLALGYLAYFGLRLQFAVTSVLQENLRGMAAIKRSWDMTRRTFLSVAWHNLILISAFFLISAITTAIISIFGEGLLAQSLQFVANAAIQTFILIPVAMFFQVHLFQRYASAHPAKK